MVQSRAKNKRGNVLFRRLRGHEYYPVFERNTNKRWSEMQKLHALEESGLIQKRKKNTVVTPTGFFAWMLSRGAPKAWSDMGSEEKSRWAKRLVLRVIKNYRDEGTLRVRLRDNFVQRGGKPGYSYAPDVESVFESLTGDVLAHLQSLQEAYRELSLSEKQKALMRQKMQRISNLYTIYGGITTDISRGRISIE